MLEKNIHEMLEKNIQKILVGGVSTTWLWPRACIRPPCNRDHSRAAQSPDDRDRVDNNHHDGDDDDDDDFGGGDFGGGETPSFHPGPFSWNTKPQ